MKKQIIDVLPYAEKREVERYLRVEKDGESEVIAARITMNAMSTMMWRNVVTTAHSMLRWYGIHKVH